MYNLFSFTQSFLVLLFLLQLFCWNWALKDHQDLLVPRSYSFFSVLVLFDFMWQLIYWPLPPCDFTLALWLCLLLSPRPPPPHTHTITPVTTMAIPVCGPLPFFLHTHPGNRIPSQNCYLIISEKIIFKYKLLFRTSGLLYLDLCIQVAWLKTKLIL